MKKLIYPFITGIIAVTLTACGSNDEGKQSNDEDQTKTAQTEQQDQKKQQEKQMEEMQKKLDKQKVEEKETVAIVNDKELLGRDYNMALSSLQMQMQQMGQDPTSAEAAKQVKEQTIDSLVGQTLILQEADKKGYQASDAEIEKQLAKTKEQYKDDKKFEAALKQAGLDMTALKTQTAENIKYTKYVEKEIPAEQVTDEEIQAYYDQSVQQGSASGQEPPKLEEIKPQIKQQLEQQKQQEKLVQQVEELKKSAKVDIKI
ncbi:peptidylprolyl isomerase [Peribacillus cavernae]|uniref:peptidylprolyl isomerase n=1 Tax=Peribacillus cavernae TaxID=1674310 RepID=A0A3S0VFT2_9BACI|nr:SurA N-terminal domain-containing protein [Peribacillus cavernae]MDQ0219464.1 FKBP-type peptidyl-prolyl cis-trans isomerase (trigger factor) [Peribacillus cavernae]RUQ27113.1 peptidylprolyl isomerase [Peribacillus cavernae]